MARRLAAGLAVSAVLLSSVVACGGDDDPSGLPTLGSGGSSGTPTSSTDPTGTPTSPATGTTSQPPGTLPSTIAVHSRKIVTKSPAEKAAATAFVSYITVRLTAYNQVKVDLNALAKTSTGAALNAVRVDVAGLKARKQHTVGEVWVDVSPVVVKGTTATVTSCMDNTTVDVDAKGKPTSVPKPFYNIKSTLQFVGGRTWVVSAITFRGDTPCK